MKLSRKIFTILIAVYFLAVPIGAALAFPVQGEKIESVSDSDDVTVESLSISDRRVQDLLRELRCLLLILPDRDFEKVWRRFQNTEVVRYNHIAELDAHFALRVFQLQIRTDTQEVALTHIFRSAQLLQELLDVLGVENDELLSERTENNRIQLNTILRLQNEVREERARLRMTASAAAAMPANPVPVLPTRILAPTPQRAKAGFVFRF